MWVLIGATWRIWLNRPCARRRYSLMPNSFNHLLLLGCITVLRRCGMLLQFITNGTAWSAGLSVTIVSPAKRLNWSKCLFWCGVGPSESTSQTASRSVQLFLQGSRSWQTDWPTDRPTDRPCYSVCNIRPHRSTYSTAIRPKNNKWSK